MRQIFVEKEPYDKKFLFNKYYFIFFVATFHLVWELYKFLRLSDRYWKILFR